MNERIETNNPEATEALPKSLIEIAHHYNLEDYDAVYRIENKSIVRIK